MSHTHAGTFSVLRVDACIFIFAVYCVIVSMA